MKTLNWTIQDLDLMPEDDKRYEIIDGELYVSKQSDWQHQLVSGQIFALLQTWSAQSQAGIANLAPGLIFAEDEAVVPDVIWITPKRLEAALWEDGKLHTSPELVVEVVSPGSTNARRDREMKLKLYSRRGADEYWIVDWREQTLEIYRRQEGVLELEKTLKEMDVLQTPLLPGFSCQVSKIFTSILREP